MSRGDQFPFCLKISLQSSIMPKIYAQIKMSKWQSSLTSLRSLRSLTFCAKFVYNKCTLIIYRSERSKRPQWSKRTLLLRHNFFYAFVVLPTWSEAGQESLSSLLLQIALPSQKSTDPTCPFTSTCDRDCNAILVRDFFQTTDTLSMRSGFLVYIHVIFCRRKHFERIYSDTHSLGMFYY